MTYSNPWFTNMMNQLNAITDKLEPNLASETRQLFLEKCSDQYTAGHKAGVAWEQSKK